MNWNRLIVIVHDLMMVPIAWLGAYWMRFNLESIPEAFLEHALQILPILLLIQALTFQYFGLYRGIWRFASIPDLIRIIKAVFVGACITALGVELYIHMQSVPRSVFPLYIFLLIGLLGSARLTVRWLKDYSGLFSNAEKVLIIGAGTAGEAVIRELFRDPLQRYRPVVIVDDEIENRGQEIHGVRVRGTIAKLPELVNRYAIKLIIIALPEVSGEKMRHIIALCEETQVPFRTLPTLMDIATGNMSINQLREVSIEDLLGRKPVTLEWDKITDTFTEKVVLVTGGGGSIGSELCRQIGKLNPKQLIIIETNEFNLYSIDLEFKKNFPHLSLVTLLINILDKIAINNVFEMYRPDIVFHAAAYKHVPLLESQIRVAIRNNVIGTHLVADAAVANHVKKFVLISTDKAVNPTNIMGATKRAAEILCQNYNKHAKTQFITVRFGNVLGSAGSVVPLFKKQLGEGGPLTVTHPDITRFFMTIPEATLLILQAMAMGKGGEIFVLDMGEPIKITYLAEQMIRLSGKEPGKDIRIEYTGLRPGEKLYEELFYESEALQPTSHQKIMQAHSLEWEWQELQDCVNQLESACEQDSGSLKAILQRMVTTYQATGP